MEWEGVHNSLQVVVWVNQQKEQRRAIKYLQVVVIELCETSIKLVVR
jgi:hypothetical protein